jgi:hypothetical protein
MQWKGPIQAFFFVRGWNGERKRKYQLVAAAAVTQGLPGGSVHERERPVTLVVRHVAGIAEAPHPTLHEKKTFSCD